MISRIIVASFIGILSFICIILSLHQNIKEGKIDYIRAFYGIMIAMSASVTTIAVMWLVFII